MTLSEDQSKANATLSLKPETVPEVTIVHGTTLPMFNHADDHRKEGQKQKLNQKESPGADRQEERVPGPGEDHHHQEIPIRAIDLLHASTI